MGIITKMRRQTAVYWAPGVADEYGRQATAVPVDVACRWDDIASEFIDDKGTQAVSKSRVYVDRDMVVGGWLWQGTVATLPGDINDNPQAIGASKIRQFEKIGNVKNTEQLRTAIL